MIRLTDDKNEYFEIIGTVEDISSYFGWLDIDDCYELVERIKEENENADMNFYHLEQYPGYDY